MIMSLLVRSSFAAKSVEETPAMIYMIMPTHFDDKKVILEEDLVVKIKFISETIEQDLTKDLTVLEVIYSHKISSSRRVTHKHKNKMKH